MASISQNEINELVQELSGLHSWGFKEVYRDKMNHMLSLEVGEFCICVTYSFYLSKGGANLSFGDAFRYGLVVPAVQNTISHILNLDGIVNHPQFNPAINSLDFTIVERDRFQESQNSLLKIELNFVDDYEFYPDRLMT